MHTAVADVMRDLTAVPGGVPNPPHEVTNQVKLNDLVEDMASRGWVGPPVVVHGEWALTGSHRIAAVVELWNNHGVDVPIPRVDIQEVCAAYGVDWDYSLDGWCGDRYEAAREVADRLPADVVDYLGLDLH